MNKEEQDTIQKMIEIFKTNDYDWMGTLITDTNKLTFHHIIRRKNGKTEINNGALLTKSSHMRLNKLLVKDPYLFDLWQVLFMDINKSMSPINEEIQDRIQELRKLSGESIYSKVRKQ